MQISGNIIISIAWWAMPLPILFHAPYLTAIAIWVSAPAAVGILAAFTLYQATYEAVVANKMGLSEQERVSIAGKFCESGDILLYDSLLPKLESGDILAVPASGAYAPSMASNYNMAPRPPIIMVREGSARLIRRRETYQDLIRNDIF